MKSYCGCLPGSEENHWFEVRCAKCIKAESDQWKAMMERFPQTLDTIRKARQNRDIQTEERRQDN